MNVQDKAGAVIEVGDLIIYGHALGRCAALQYGKVLAIKLKTKTKWRGSLLLSEDYETPHFTVQGVADEPNPWLLRKGTLQFADRILVINREQVPQTTLKLLDGVKV